MKLVTAQQMQALDRAAIEGHGIPSLTLMERAGRAVADTALPLSQQRAGPAVVVCGRGNNGGDGLVAARLLIEAGVEVNVFLLGRASELSPDARANWERLAPLTTHIIELTSADALTFHFPTFAGASVIIDAIFGTGLARNVTGDLAKIIEYIGSVRWPVIAVDIPSGLSADTGKALGCAVRANVTVTFGMPKLGLYIGEADEYVGDVVVADIGIPQEESDAVEARYHVTDAHDVAPLIPPRKPASHKGTYGHVAVVAGSGGKLGAGYLACMAALRAGAGLVTYYVPEAAFEKFDARYPEIMCQPIPDRGRGHFHLDGLAPLIDHLKGASAVAIGPALGTHEETRAFMHEFVERAAAPLVIDADGLNVLDLADLKRRGSSMVLTPHPGECARMLRIATDEVQSRRFQLAVQFASQRGVHLVLKGYHTISAMPDGSAYINPTGNPAMASAGMGDALTGAIAGLIAQGLDPARASVAGVYLHGLAGDMAAHEIGERGVVASDVIKRLPAAMRATVKGANE